MHLGQARMPSLHLHGSEIVYGRRYDPATLLEVDEKCYHSLDSRQSLVILE